MANFSITRVVTKNIVTDSFQGIRNRKEKKILEELKSGRR